MEKKIVFIAIFIVVIGASVLALNNPYIKTQVYTDDRITGIFTMTVDGKPYEPLDKTLEYESVNCKENSN